MGQADLKTTSETVLALHSCLKRLLQMMPAAGQSLFVALEGAYPSKYEDRMDQLVFLDAALMVGSYCSECSRGLLDLVMRNVLQLDADVDLQVALGDEQLTFAFESSNAEDSFAMERIKGEKIKADTVDALMEKLFDHVDRQRLEDVTCAVPLSSFPPEFSKQADFFRDLLHVFNARVLTSPKAQFVQYLIFYACSKNPSVFAPIFLQFLMSIFRDFSLDHQMRAAAAAYIASFLARFARLQPETVANTLSAVATWSVELSTSNIMFILSFLVCVDFVSFFVWQVCCSPRVGQDFAAARREDALSLLCGVQLYVLRSLLSGFDGSRQPQAGPRLSVGLLAQSAALCAGRRSRRASRHCGR